LFLGVLFFANGLYANIDSLKLKLQSAGDNEKVYIYLSLCEECFRAHPSYAIELMTEAIVFDEGRGVYQNHSSYYNKIGNTYFNQGIKYLALDAYFTSLKYAEELQDIGSVAYCNNDIGNVYFSQGNFETAKTYYLNSVSQFRDLKNNLGLAVAYNNLGLVFLELKKYDLALDYYYKALKLREDNGDVGIIAHSNMFIAEVYLKMSKYDEALQYFNLAYDQYGSIHEKANQAKVTYNIGEVYLASGDKSLALSYFKQASSAFSEANYLVWEIRSSINIAGILIDSKRFSEAKSQIEYAMRLGETIGNVSFIAEFYRLYSQMFIAQKNYKSAYASRIRYEQFVDSIQKINHGEKISNLQYSISKYKEELKTENLQRELDHKKKQKFFYLLIISLVLILLLNVIRSLSQKRKSEKLIYKQQSELSKFELEKNEDDLIQISRELELKNRELTSKTMGIIKNSEFVSEVIGELRSMKVKRENQTTIDAIIEKLKSNLKEDSWKEFEIRFTSVYKEFYTQLNSLHPKLTPNERRLCAFLRLNMSTKEISSITYQSSKSIDVARSRLRKKMELPREENLITYLSQF